MHQKLVRGIFACAATQKHPGQQAAALLIYTEIPVIKTTREAVKGLWEEERDRGPSWCKRGRFWFDRITPPPLVASISNILEF